MAVTFSNTNKPLNPRGNDASPLAYNRAALYSGKALSFDGVNDVVNVTTNDLDFGASDFSVSAIVDWSGSGTDGKLAYAERGSSGSELAAWQIRTDGSGNMIFQANTAADGWQGVIFSGVVAIIADGLTHLNFVRVGTGVTLYINGVFYSTGTGSIQATLDTPNGAFVIGNRIGANEYWNGQIAGFKIFNTALTPAQIADLYNNPEKIVPTGVDNTALKLWLPMMEGAGTTAYDGSGNGNHGTINGATYTHGIGAAVAQTSVIDWNKGSNLIINSLDFVTGFSINNAVISQANITAPDGSNLVRKLVATNANTFHLTLQGATQSAGIYTQSVYAKAEGRDFLYMNTRVDTGSNRYGVKFNIANGTYVDDATSGSPTNTSYSIQNMGNGWFRCSISIQHTSGTISAVFSPAIAGAVNGINDDHQGDGVNGIYIWGGALSQSTIPQPYVYTGATAQPTPVLLPAGLTTGRDITGVNLFENVRKQGALNLDGNSWAEVHDNASLDFSSGMTLEAWVQLDDADGSQSILGKWNFGASKKEYLLYYAASTNKFQALFGHGSAVSVAEFPITATGQWFHLVATTDGSTITPYVNGVAGTTAAQSTSLAASDMPLKIGTDDTGSDKTKKPIAQPRIYNRALTASEVLRNYNSGKNTYTNS